MQLGRRRLLGGTQLAARVLTAPKQKVCFYARQRWTAGVNPPRRTHNVKTNCVVRNLPHERAEGASCHQTSEAQVEPEKAQRDDCAHRKFPSETTRRTTHPERTALIFNH